MNIDELGTKVSQLQARVTYAGNEQRRLEEETEKVRKEFDALKAQCAAPQEVEKYRKVLLDIANDIRILIRTLPLDANGYSIGGLNSTLRQINFVLGEGSENNEHQ